MTSVTGAAAPVSIQDVRTRVEADVARQRLTAVNKSVDDLVAKGELKFSNPTPTEKGVHVTVTYQGKTERIDLPGKPDGKVDAGTLKAGLARRFANFVGGPHPGGGGAVTGSLLNRLQSLTGLTQGFRDQIESVVQRQLAAKPAAPAPAPKVAAALQRLGGSGATLRAFAPVQVATAVLGAANDAQDAKDPAVVSAIVDAMEAGDQGVLMSMKMKWPSNPLAKAVREEIHRRQTMA